MKKILFKINKGFKQLHQNTNKYTLKKNYPTKTFYAKMKKKKKV